MRRLIHIAILLAIVWSIYWLAVAAGLSYGLPRAIAGLRDSGWQLRYRQLERPGFPLWLGLRLRGVKLRGAGGTVSWRIPDLALSAPSWRPTALSATLRGSQTLDLTRPRLSLSTNNLRVQLRPGLAPALPLRHGAIAAKSLLLRAPAGWRLRVADARLDLRQTAGAPGILHVQATLTGVSPAPALIGLNMPGAGLPQVLDVLAIKATLGFDAPLVLRPEARQASRLREITLLQGAVTWADMSLSAQGHLTLDKAGIPAGRLMLGAQNWHRMLEIAQAAGRLSAARRATIGRALSVLAAFSPRADTVKAPLIFINGQMYLGPVPLGPAPRLRPNRASSMAPGVAGRKQGRP